MYNYRATSQFSAQMLLRHNNYFPLILAIRYDINTNVSFNSE